MRQGSATLNRRLMDLGRYTPDGSAEPAPGLPRRYKHGMALRDLLDSTPGGKGHPSTNRCNSRG
eukprot:3859050-Pyramimonas_sp.AAC.1